MRRRVAPRSWPFRGSGVRPFSHSAVPTVRRTSRSPSQGRRPKAVGPGRLRQRPNGPAVRLDSVQRPDERSARWAYDRLSTGRYPGRWPGLGEWLALWAGGHDGRRVGGEIERASGEVSQAPRRPGTRLSSVRRTSRSPSQGRRPKAVGPGRQATRPIIARRPNGPAVRLDSVQRPEERPARWACDRFSAGRYPGRWPGLGEWLALWAACCRAPCPPASKI
jgi:hypothetical protein